MNNIIEIWNLLHPQIFVILVNTVWQIAVLTVLIFLTIFLIKIKSAVVRYVLWLIVLLSPLFLPLLNFYVPAVQINELFRHRIQQAVYDENSLPHRTPSKVSGSDYYLSKSISESKSYTTQETVSSNEKQRIIPANRNQPEVTTSESNFAFPLSLKEILLLFWMLGAFGMTARLAKGLHGLRSLRVNAVYIKDDSVINLLNELRDSFGIRQEIRIATSDKLTYPVSFGWLKPIILMPYNFVDTMSFDEIRMLFIHELVHFKRRDYLVNIVISFLRIPLFFHLLYIFAQRQLKVQQEHICDDWVLQFSQKRTVYAQCLLRQAEFAMLKNVPSVGTSVISGFKNLRRRIDMILDSKRTLSINLSKKMAVLVLLICCVFTVLAATTRLLPFAFAQQTEAEKLITKIKEARTERTRLWSNLDEELSQEQRKVAYRKSLENGLTLCKQFLEEYPQHKDISEVIFYQVSFLSALGRHDEAEKLAREFLEKNSTGSYADGVRWTLFRHYRSKGKYEKALAELELIEEPEWAVHWERYQIYQQSGGYSLAECENERFLCLQSIMGKPAPLFSAETIDGKKISLEKLRGKVVVLTFHRGYSPSSSRVKSWKQLYDKYKVQEDFTMVSIVSDSNPEIVRNYVKLRNIDWPHILDKDDQEKSIAWRYGHYSYRYNATYLIDKHGQIRDLGLPVQPGNLGRLKTILEIALAEDAKEPPTTEFAQVHYAKAFKIAVENNPSLDRIDEAIREYETAIRLHPSPSSNWYYGLAQEYGEKADWYWERGMYEEAISPRLKQVELQQEIYPEEINRRELALSYLRLAELYVGIAQNKKAIKTLNKAIELDSAVADFVLERRWFQILEEEDKQLQKFAAERKSIHEQRIEHRRKEEAQLYNKLREIYPAIVEVVIEPTETFKEGIAGGVVIDEDGYIIACSEVADQKEIEVRVEREDKVETYQAQVFERSEELGIAWLKIDADGLTPPPFTDSDKVEPHKVPGGIRPIKVKIIGLVRTPNGSIRKLPRSSGISQTFRNEEGQAISWRFFDRVSSDGISCQVLATEQGEVFAIRIADSEHGVPQFVPINLVKQFVKDSHRDKNKE